MVPLWYKKLNAALNCLTSSPEVVDTLGVSGLHYHLCLVIRHGLTNSSYLSNYWTNSSILGKFEIWGESNYGLPD